MGRIETSREIVIKSGSPLAHHSLNQAKIRTADQGAIKLSHILANQPMPAIIPERRTVYIETPLNQEFSNQLLPFMIELAQQREAAEVNSAIPERLVNSAIDVNRIFVGAKKKRYSNPNDGLRGIKRHQLPCEKK